MITNEAWIYLNECNKKGLFIIKNEGKNVKSWFCQSKESFSKKFIIVAGFSYKGELKVKKVVKDVKLKVLSTENL